MLLVFCIAVQPLYIAFATELEESQADEAMSEVLEVIERVGVEYETTNESAIPETDQDERDADDHEYTDSNQLIDEVTDTDRQSIDPALHVVGEAVTSFDKEKRATSDLTPDVETEPFESESVNDDTTGEEEVTIVEEEGTKPASAIESDTETTESEAANDELAGEAGSSSDEEESVISTPASHSETEEQSSGSSAHEDTAEEETASSTETDNALSDSAEADAFGTVAPDTSASRERVLQQDASRDTSGMTQTLDDHDCTVLGDGALYCVERDQSVHAGVEPGVARVYARAGPNGNKEIFFLEQGRTTQITHNRREDFAPMYDPHSNRIVWNTLIDDRLQIMMHDRTTGETRQITHTPHNNSNPHLHGDVLTWQAWKNNNWEIMLVRNVSRDPVVPERLTSNSTHDMFPRVFDTLVTWQTQTRDSWHVAVYDIERRQFSYIEKTGEGRYENPRFVLVFDERAPSGDVEVVGYDIATRSQIPLVPLGRDVPSPMTPQDDTGEAIPAQTQNGSSTIKTAQRDEGDDESNSGDLDVVDENDDTFAEFADDFEIEGEVEGDEV